MKKINTEKTIYKLSADTLYKVRKGDFMTNEDIIKKYNLGFPMKRIIDDYYAEINLNQERIRYIGNDRIINRDFMPRKEAQAYVEQVIVQYLVQKKKERKE